MTSNRARIPVYDDDDYLNAINKDIFNASSKIGIQINRDMVTNNIKATKGKLTARILKDRLLLEICGMRFSRNHRLFAVFDRKFQQLFTAGIVEYHVGIDNQLRNPKRYSHLYPDEPQVLTLEHLEAGFVIWLAAVLFAAIVFLLQWLMMFVDVHFYKFLMLYKPN